ncbi:chitin deacetylase 1 [Dendroctonus ponderosae]|uniref:chitin deacetylase 1 n=1 Tax=Dendroctonus ponderosae TaxID=77166 RepID=UPI002035A1BA|nr:chitin deacetylase 1 [Dendroctonus ponderosae]
MFLGCSSRVSRQKVMDTDIERRVVKTFLWFAVSHLVLEIRVYAGQIKCIESGRFYRNPEPRSRDVDHLWSAEECSKYYLCLEGEVFDFRCSTGLVFDVDSQICESREKVRNCAKETESSISRIYSDEPINSHNVTFCDPSTHEICEDNHTCIPTQYICDGSADCPDGTDEANCSPTNTPAAPVCDSARCVLPDCFCSKNGTQIPGHLARHDVPQMVLVTFEDSINDENIDFYKQIFSGKYLNPNNCPIAATFFVSHQYNNYFFTQKLWNHGHEIAVHSISHKLPEEWWAENATIEDWFDEMVGQANILNKFSTVRLTEIKGLRAPFLRIGWNRQYLMMNEFGFLYDSSMVAPFSYVPLWPYTLDYKIPHQCFRQMCPTRSYPGLWEMVINQLEALEISCATLDSCPSELSGQEIYQTLIRNFNRHYSTNRAPFGIHLQAAWFENTEYLAAFQEFLDVVLSKPDVWFVTNSQAIEWMQHPTPLKKLLKFHPWDCRKHVKQAREIACQTPNNCQLASRALKQDVELQTCNKCPKKYPWVKNEFGAN